MEKRSLIEKLRSLSILRALGYISLPFFPLFCFALSEYFTYVPYKVTGRTLDLILRAWDLHTLEHLFGCILIVFIFVLLLLIFKKAAAAVGILGFFTFVFSYVDYMKTTLNGDHFVPRDITMLGHSRELAGFIGGSIPRLFYIGIAVFALWLLYLAVMDTELPLRWYIRLPAAFILVVAVFSAFGSHDKAERILNRLDLYFEDTVLQDSNYRANGFISAFFLNVLSMNVEVPAGYGEKAVDEILSGYERSAGGDTKYDVIVVLSESFFDIRELDGISLSANPLENYDRIIAGENCISGKIYTTAYGGGTVRPEFSILTGLSTDYLPSGPSPYEYVTHETESMVSNYNDNGYRTVALHLYNKSFYSRNTAYPLLGFDEFYGLDDMYNLVTLRFKREYATDESTFRCMKYLLEQSDEPTFMSVITIQNHQPFKEIPDEDVTIEVSSDILSDTGLAAVETYTQGLYDADLFLGDLVDYIDQRDRPTILLFYGDHLATLGTAEEVYKDTGYFKSGDRNETLIKYSTPFLIYSNRGFEKEVFASKDNNEVSAYYFLPIIAELTGFEKTPYMEFLLDMYSRVPYFNIRLEMPKSADTEALENALRYITYDRLIGNAYSSE